MASEGEAVRQWSQLQAMRRAFSPLFPSPSGRGNLKAPIWSHGFSYDYWVVCVLLFRYRPAFAVSKALVNSGTISL
jgi:hypothetical protein